MRIDWTLAGNARGFLIMALFLAVYLIGVRAGRR